MSAEQLIEEASQLSLPELDQLVSKVISLRAQRVGPGLSVEEGQLLQKINRGIPSALRKRSEELIEKRDAERLSGSEQEELKRLTGEIEQIEAERIVYLKELASLRDTTLTTLMEKLGLNGPMYG